MTKNDIHRLGLVSLLICIFSLIPLCAAFAETPAGKIIHVHGQVEVMGAEKRVAAPGQTLYKGDTIITGKDGGASILLADESLLQLKNNTRFTLQEVGVNAAWHVIRTIAAKIGLAFKSRYILTTGEVWLRNKNIDVDIAIETPTSVCGIRGTELGLKVASDQTATASVLEGTISVANEYGSLIVRAGEQATARPGAAPFKTMLLTPEDAVQWTIPIPPIFDDRQAPEKVRQAMRDLEAGYVNEARAQMIDFTGADPNRAAGWNLLALTNIMTGRTTEALAASERAVQSDPHSPEALIIRSYALQASFDLERATESLKRALELEGGNVVALLNLARLQFGMGATDEAAGNLEKAKAIAPQNADLHNLQGFLLLAQRRTEEAMDAFRKASALDSSLAEPHMGLGLALMRKGDAAQAMEEITTAVLLEPRRSLFMSYWGKMLYQIGRFDKALDVLKTAGVLDPRDPTPEFYQAIVLRDLNRPTEAIRALNKAVALNDNRAVYRSRFLLDTDLAVRNVDLSILYNQLGLSAWATNRAAASVSQDYTNASGHLFLGGALSAADDRAWSSAGEYLLARLFEPANANTFNTFNSYTSFFEKPSVGGTVTGAVGNNGSRGGEIVAYGALPDANLAFGTQLSYNETDGWRDTNGERQRSLALLAKWDASPKDSFMAVASHLMMNQRDKSSPRFEYDDPADPKDWYDDRLTRLEIGYHRRLSPGSDLLFYVSRMNYRGELYDHQVLGPINASAAFEQPHYQVQGEYLHKIAGHQLVLGTTQYQGENEMTVDYSLINFHVANKKDRSLESYFIKDIWTISSSFTADASIYYDHMQNSDAGYGTEWHLRQWSPRLGIAFRATPKDTLRLSAFRYLLPFMSSRIDPMDVAGVPVFRNAFEGTLVDEADLVWEREWASGYFSAGLFYMDKKYDHLVTSGNLSSMQSDRGRQKGTEMVVNQMIGEGFGLASRYRYQYIEDNGNPAGDREDHLASVSLKYIHRSGVSSSVTESFRHERFMNAVRGNENIWLTDARIGYEFPGKRGALSFEMRNIFNQHFNWITDTFVSAGRAPGRETLLTLSVNF